MTNGVLIFVFVVTACFPGTQTNVGEGVPRERSFCDAQLQEEIDSVKNGKGNIKHETSRSRESWIIRLNEREDDGILISVTCFNLVRSFLVIREARIQIVAEVGAEDIGKIQFVSGESTEPFKFFIPYSRSFYMEICPEENRDEIMGSGAFTLTYERSVPDYGDGPLPGEPPEVEKERQAVEIQFKGKTPEEFMNNLFIMTFKTAVKSIAFDFCSSAEIPFDDNKSAEEMVTIHAIHQCPLEWSDRDICVSVYHSVFVSGNDDSPMSRIWEYQLIRTNLEKMWASAKKDHLRNIGLTIYEPPVRTVVVGWWFTTVVVPFAILIALFYVIRFLKDKYLVEHIQNKLPAVDEAGAVERKRKSKLKPNKYQQMPSFLKDEKPAGNAGQGLQPQQRSYSAALLFSRLRLEGIPE